MLRNIFVGWLFTIALITTATAQIPTKGNVFFGYSYLRSDLSSGNPANLNGWNGLLIGKRRSTARRICHFGFATNWLMCCTPLPRTLSGRVTAFRQKVGIAQ